jgi:Nucleotidyl transferase of unknown function (DUF2204)
MESTTQAPNEIHPQTHAFYSGTLSVLKKAGIPFLVGGTYAFSFYTGIERASKDFDIFVHPQDCQPALDVLRDHGWKIELTFPHWLGKAFSGGDFMDIIFSSGNGVAEVDDIWFKHAVEAEVLGMNVLLSPPEEMIWSKAFLMERERYDGADVAHLFRACAETLDWNRLFFRFGDHWRIFLSHLILFGFIYPSERDRIPSWVMRDLMERLKLEVKSDPPEDRVCHGTMISREQYLSDVEREGYVDARLEPLGNMSAEEIAHWTASIDNKK